MKYLSYIFIAAALTVAGCGRGSGLDHDHDHNMHADEHGHDEHEGEGHEHHDGVIEIHDHQAEELGIKVTEMVPVEFGAPLTASGEVIYNPSSQGFISAPMSGKVSFDRGIAPGAKVTRGSRIGRITTDGMAGGDQLKAARIEYDAAKKEVDRLAALRAEGFVTVGEYNQAVANLERAKNSLSGGAGSVITAPVSGVISSLAVGEGGYVNAGDIVGDIVGEGALTLRVDVPVKEGAAVAGVRTANVKFPGIDTVVEATAMSGKGTASPAPGYVSLYFALPPLDNVVAGSFAEVYLPQDNGRKVLAVPVDAITDRMGQKMVYVKEADEDHYQRVPVTTGATDGRLVEVTGINPGDLVVTEGVTFVRLAENAGATPPGHTHNH